MINLEQNWSLVTGITYIKKYTDWNTANNVISGATTSGLLTQYTVPKDEGPATRLKQWENINNLTGQTDGFAHYFNINLYNTTLKEETPYLILNDFNFNVPSGKTISGIQVKITKSSKKYHDYQDTSVTEWVSDNFWYNNNIYTYTNDTLVTLDTNSGETYSFDNKLIDYTEEEISETSVGNKSWLTSDTDPQYRYLSPIGIWTEEKTDYIYGSEVDNWGNDWTIDEINSSDFSVKMKMSQSVFKSYEEIPTFRSSLEKETWENTEYTSYEYEENTFGYMTTKIHDVSIRIIYLEEQIGYYITERETNHTISNTVNVDDVYFNFQNCFNGICYNFVNEINDIYDISLLTGNNKSINNTYTEYNIINKYLVNLNYVDILVDINVDLSKSYFKLDKIDIKPGHRILLINQTDTSENDIYLVKDNYYLELSDLLSNRTKSDKAKFYIKLGTYKEKQYHLVNVGNSFPIIGEEKTFVEKHSYIIKNKINYNVINVNSATTYDFSDNVITTPCKILFTNYNVARTLKDNRTFYNSININLSETENNEINISYLDHEYIISDEYGEKVYYDFTGDTSTSGITNYSGHTEFNIDSTFSGRSSIGDHVLITILTGTTTIIDDDLIISSYINYSTTIKSMTTEKLTIFGQIPSYTLNDLSDGYTVRILNLQYCPTGMTNFSEYINNSPYKNLIYAIDLTDYLNISVKMSDNDKYYDYTLFDIVHSGETFKFTSNNQYIGYKLDTFLERIDNNLPVNIYNENYLLSDQFTVTKVTEDYTGHTFSDTYYILQSSLLKITPTANYVEKLKEFKAFTFIDFGKLSTHTEQVTDNQGNINYVEVLYSPYVFENGYESGRTMIYEVTDDYMLIQKPTNYDELTNFYDIINVSKLTDISDILFDVYTNYTHNYYFKNPDNIKNCISGQYGKIVRDNSYIRSIATGIIYCDNGEFDFDLFNVEVNEDFSHKDVNLTYQPIELIDVGIDKITKLPIPISIDNLDIPFVEDSVYYTGTTNMGNIYGAPHTITPEVSVNNTLVYDDKIYINLNYEGIIHFVGEETDYGNIYNQGLIQRNNAVLVLDIDDFTENKMEYSNLIGYSSLISNYDYTNEFISLKSNRIHIDNRGITYNSGYFRVMENNYYTSSYLKVDTTLTGLTSKSKQNGYCVTYDEDLNKISGFTYSNIKSNLHYVRNVISTDENIYITYQYTDLTIISFSPAAYTANGNGEIFPMATRSVGPWVATEIANWFDLDNYIGNSGDIISITVDANTGITNRNYSIEFDVNNNIEYFVLSQPVEHRISISPENILVEGDGTGGTNISVTSTYEWNTINNQSWGGVSWNPILAFGDLIGNSTNIIDNVDDLFLIVYDNETGYARTGTSLFECKDVSYTASTTLTFYQDDSIAIFSNNVISRGLGGNNIRNGGSYNRILIATDNWTSPGFTESWLSVDTTTGIIGETNLIFEIDSNGDGDFRSATATFTCNTATFDFTINQPVEDEISLSNSYETVDGDGDTFSVTVTSSYDWTLTEDLSWASASAYSGSNGDTIIFTILDNETGDSRIGEATFTCGIASTGLTINQPDSILVVPDSTSIYRDGGTINGTVTATGAWTTSTTSWLSVIPSTQSGDYSIVISATTNDSGSYRSTGITFTRGTSTHTITIGQEKETEISISPEIYYPSGNGEVITGVEITSTYSWVLQSPIPYDSMILYVDPFFSNTAGVTPLIGITVSENDTGLPRTGYTVFESGLKTATIALYQNVKDEIFLNVVSGSLILDGDGDYVDIQVDTSGATTWSLNLIPPITTWLSPNIFEGDSGDVIRLTASDNESGLSRNGELEFYAGSLGDNSAVATINVEQPDSIVTRLHNLQTIVRNIEFEEFITGSSVEPIIVDLVTTGSWSSYVPGGWNTILPSSSSNFSESITIDPALNTGVATRTATATFTRGTATHELEISQPISRWCYVTNGISTITVDRWAQIYRVSMTSNTGWTASASVGTFFTVSNSATYFDVSFSENLYPHNNRYGEILITWGGTNINIEVIQSYLTFP